MFKKVFEVLCLIENATVVKFEGNRWVEPTNSQNEESKWILHGLCSPLTGNTALLQQAV